MIRIVSLVVITVVASVWSPAFAFDKEVRDREELREERRITFIEQQQPAEGFQAMAATPCVGGLAGTYPCHDIDLLAFMPLSSIGGGNGNDLWGWTDPVTGREYALMGRSNGTAFVDISDPLNPVYVGNLPPHGSNSSWRDIKVYSDHAYIVSEAAGHGMQIFDLTQLRGVVAPPVAFTETAHYDGFGSAHNVAINEATGFAYAVGTGTCSGGPHFVDLQVPTAPVYAGCHIESFYTHDTQCVIYAGPDILHQGREICVNSNESRINIIDVNDKGNPVVLSQTVYDGVRYAHQGWLTEDHRYFLQGDELDEQNLGHNTRTRIFDVGDLDAPVLIGTYDGPTTAIDHNLYTHGGYAFEANYRAGLRILDLADIGAGNLTEIAHFDIYPSSDSASFNGAWSVYPYFDSGVVIVSGIEQGLFVLRPLLDPDFQIDATPQTLAVCAPADGTTTLQLTDRNDYTGSVTLGTSGLPAGASASFSVNPVVVPGTSELSVATAALAPGSYPFTVTGTDGTLGHDQALILDVADAIPGAATPVLPADGAVGVSRTPTFQWGAAAQGFTYDFELSTDAGFASILFAVTTAGTAVAPEIELDPLTSFYWRVRGSNSCGTGVDSAVFRFTTLDVPPILLVDDDDNGPDVQASYQATLTALGQDFDLWDTTNSDNEPGAETLSPYEIVIWFTGDEFGGAAGPGAGGESALETWLDSSRCLLISSQDYYYDRGLTGLMQSHLGLAAATSDVSQSSAVGQGAVFSGLGPYALSFPYSNYTDTLTPDASAEIAFDGSVGIIAVDKDTGLYRTAFWSFGLETLPTEADREAALGTFLSWCDALAGVDADSDGATNGEDCAPGDAGLWSVPSAARGLFVTTAGSGNLTWQIPLDPGGTSTLFDVLRSTDPSSFVGADCIESGEVDTVATDTLSPLRGELFGYLIRVRNGCGETLGHDSRDEVRSGGSCP